MRQQPRSIDSSSLCCSGGMAGQHYCLRWDNYQSNMTSVFHQLLQTEAFVDVTLACNEASLKAHKVGWCYTRQLAMARDKEKLYLARLISRARARAQNRTRSKCWQKDRHRGLEENQRDQGVNFSERESTRLSLIIIMSLWHLITSLRKRVSRIL